MNLRWGSPSSVLLNLFYPNRFVPRITPSAAAAEGEFLSVHCICWSGSSLTWTDSMMLNLCSKAPQGLSFSGSSSHTSHQLYDLPERVRRRENFTMILIELWGEGDVSFNVIVAGLEKCSGRTPSQLVLSFGKCGQVCATMMGISSSTGVCVCWRSSKCVSLNVVHSSLNVSHLLFQYPAVHQPETEAQRALGRGADFHLSATWVYAVKSLSSEDEKFLFNWIFSICVFQCTWSTDPWIQSIPTLSSSVSTSKFHSLIAKIWGDFQDRKLC